MSITPPICVYLSFLADRMLRSNPTCFMLSYLVLTFACIVYLALLSIQV